MKGNVQFLSTMVSPFVIQAITPPTEIFKYMVPCEIPNSFPANNLKFGLEVVLDTYSPVVDLGTPIQYSQGFTSEHLLKKS